MFCLVANLNVTVTVLACAVQILPHCACFFRVKEKRIAACDMAAMAASCDDNKFLIVAEGGSVFRSFYIYTFTSSFSPLQRTLKENKGRNTDISFAF